VRLALLSLLAVLHAPQRSASHSQEPATKVFRLVEVVGTLRFVSANRAGVSAYRALRDLERLGAFRLNLEAPELRQRLESEAVSLSFAKSEAVSVAELIAVAAGLDLVTEREEAPPDSDAPGKLIATVVMAPSAGTEAGRQRLRAWALRWYRNLLRSEFERQRETADAKVRVHMDLALLDMQQGNLTAAAREFRWFAENAPEHPYVPEALLNEATCFFELGDFAGSAQRASRLMKKLRISETGVKAAVLYARASLKLAGQQEAAGRHITATSTLDSVVLSLELFAGGFRDTREFPKLMLLLAEVHRRRRRPDLVLRKLDELDAVIDMILLDDADWKSAHFLRGVALVETGDYLAGQTALWKFVQRASGDERLGVAWIRLGEAELGLDDPMQAVFASREALKSAKSLGAAERSRATVLEARGRILLGDVESAVSQLQVELLKDVGDGGKGGNDELAVYLGQTLLEQGQPERAKRILVRVLENESPLGSAAAGMTGVGDRARLLLLLAEAKQGNHAQVIARALEFADSVRDASSQSRIAELVGDAYMSLGMKRLAAEAYNGRLR